MYSPTGPLLPESLITRLLSVSTTRGASSGAAMPQSLRNLQQRKPRTENEWVDLTSFYIHNPITARSDLREFLLERVEGSSLPSLLPASLIGSEVWYRLRPRVCFDNKPGLAEWLQHVHGSDMTVRFRQLFIKWRT